MTKIIRAKHNTDDKEHTMNEKKYSVWNVLKCDECQRRYDLHYYSYWCFDHS